jgi:hypothetical protein
MGFWNLYDDKGFSGILREFGKFYRGDLMLDFF